jgi:Fuc2NAc and GlcNAc transferase
MSLALGMTGYVLTRVGLGVQMRRPVLDKGDGERKLQAAPVPSSGGISVALPVLVLASGLAVWGVLPLAMLFLPVFGLVLGAWDDRRPLGSRLKMGLMLAACAVAVLGLGLQAGPVATPFGVWFGEPSVRAVGSVFFLFVVMNAFNFMDGSNGLLAGFSGVVLLCALSLGLGEMGAGSLACAAVLGGSLIAFLRVNLAGRIYAGDSGSLFLGALAGQTGLIAAGSGQGPGAWTVALVLLPFLADVFLTLIWRTFRRRPLLSAHRDHAYQRLIDLHGWSHGAVAAHWMGLSVLCWLTAGLARALGEGGEFWAFWGMALVITGLWLCVRRRRVTA